MMGSGPGPRAIIVMGVSASGKSAVGQRLAGALDACFVEGDELHPLENIARMAAGLPLTDDDRWLWLDEIRDRIINCLASARSVVVACSALRGAYRNRLRHGLEDRLRFVFLDGPRDLLALRIAHRPDHFMPPALLEDQLATLERPFDENDTITVSFERSIDAIVAEIVRTLDPDGA